MKRRTLKKARRSNAKHKAECRTFAGYIGLVNGRPEVDVWPNREGCRTLHVFLNERKAKKWYESVALVTITGVWQPADKGHLK